MGWRNTQIIDFIIQVCLVVIRDCANNMKDDTQHCISGCSF